MKGISAFVPFQNEATKKPLASLAASVTEKLTIGLAVFFAPVASTWSSLAWVVVPSLATTRKWYVFSGFIPSRTVR
jgi:hypothetical protein